MHMSDYVLFGDGEKAIHSETYKDMESGIFNNVSK